MNTIGNNMRNKRNLLDINSMSLQFPMSNYSTDAQKQEMEQMYGDNLILNKLQLLPDPLKKNLADSVITGEKTMKDKVEKIETKEYPSVKPSNNRETYNSSRATITYIMSGIYNIVGALFSSRSQYQDCESKSDEMAPQSWQPSNTEVLNKNEPPDTFFSDSSTKLDDTMNVDCRRAANECQRKLDEVHSLIDNKSKLNTQNTKQKLGQPKKVFVDPSNIVEDQFEDAFCPEICISQPCNINIQYHSPYSYHNEQFIEAACSKTKSEIKESMDIVKDLTNNDKNDLKNADLTKTDDIVSVCDDKMNRLKLLLQSKICKKNIESEPIVIPEVPKENILQSSNSQDSDCFNEVSGRFLSSSIESEDSFQIVFTDEPPKHKRLSSDCDSEDSFIVFEDNPDSCYMSNDVFGAGCDESDSDESDEPGNCKLLPSFSRTFCDLTDNSLYIHDELDEMDEVDSAKVNTLDDLREWDVKENKGLLLDARRKMEKKKLPLKKVQFSSDPPKVHVMRVWAFAARQARAGRWERYALDRERFKRRIADVEMAISWVLKPQHRTRIVFQRFRPWWNAQHRKEQEEKKLEEEKRRNQQVVENNETSPKETDKNEVKSIEGEESEASVEINGVDIISNGESIKNDNKPHIDITEEMPKIIEKLKALHINGTIVDINVLTNDNVT